MPNDQAASTDAETLAALNLAANGLRKIPWSPNSDAHAHQATSNHRKLNVVSATDNKMVKRFFPT